MTTAPAPFAYQATTGPKQAVIVPEPEPPLSPRVRIFILTLARALQMVVNGLHELAGEAKR